MTYDDIWWHTLQYSISHLCISHTLLHPSVRVIICVGLHPLYCKELWGKISALDVWRTSQWSWWHPNAQELRCERTVSMSQVAKLVNFQQGLLQYIRITGKPYSLTLGCVLRSTSVALEFLPWLLCTRRTIQRHASCKLSWNDGCKDSVLGRLFWIRQKTWSWMYLPQKWWYSGV